MSADFPLLFLCQVFRVSRSAYYAWLSGQTYVLREKKAQVSQQVKLVFEEHLQRYGSRRIEAELKESGYEAGRYQIRQRMQEQGLKAIQPRSFVPKTTQTNPNLQYSPNLLLEMDKVNQINRVWVGDITYLPIGRRRLVLSGHLDGPVQPFDRWLEDQYFPECHAGHS